MYEHDVVAFTEILSLTVRNYTYIDGCTRCSDLVAPEYPPRRAAVHLCLEWLVLSFLDLAAEQVLPVSRRLLLATACFPVPAAAESRPAHWQARLGIGFQTHSSELLVVHVC